MGKNIKKVLSQNTEIFTRHKIKRLGIFGSYLTGKNKRNSDIDLLVEFNETVDLFEFVRLTNELQKLLNVKVDLVTPNALKPYIKDKILKEVNWLERP
ncbi:MAG: nucleotidyltransferase family protein [Elusimicrobia bacterium]|nr:nucleotidyltransferase family protein [Elusimicrobiota bacterium]